MFAFSRKWTKTRQSPSLKSHPRRTILAIEQLEDHIVPSTVVYSNAFNWNGVASVVETVTFDAPGHEGQYLWNFHLTNQSFVDGGGIGTFALPAEDSGTVSGLGSSVGWTGSVGTLMGDPDLIAWQGAPIGVSGSADFWFTTIPVDIALTNGIISNPGLTTLPGGLLAVPTAAPVPPAPPGVPMPKLVGALVSTGADKFDDNVGLTSLREAIDWVDRQNLPNQQLQVKFTKDGIGIITLGSLGQLPTIEKNIFINGTDRNITIRRDAV